MKQSFRRNVAVSLVVLAVVLAGCTGGGGTPTSGANDGNDADSGRDGDAGSGDGSNDSGDAEDGGDAGDGGDSGESGSDGATSTDGVAGSTPTSSPSLTPDPTASPAATATETEPSSDASGPSLRDLLQFDDSYRFRMEASQVDGESADVQQEGRFDGSNTYFKSTVDGRTTEIYLVDGRTYMVSGGQCQEITEQWTQRQNPGNWSESEYYGNLSVRPTGTTTIDGKEMYVYEVDYDRSGLEGPFTYYVDAETGHLRKQESPHATIEMWSWGDVEPVEAPC